MSAIHTGTLAFGSGRHAAGPPRIADVGFSCRLLSTLRLRKLRGWAEGAASSAEAVGEVMTRKVRVASVERHLAELIPLFSSTGHHHIPIVDAAGRLVGIVTQSDVVAALSRPEAAA